MNIGLDIDNVISNFDLAVFKAFLKEDKLKRNRGIINKDALHINDGMFDWSRDEVVKFYANNMETIAKDLFLRKDCKKVMDRLLQEGHKLFLISHRVYPDYKHPEETTKEWLKKRKIKYTKLIISKNRDKTPECFANKIDVMFDDVCSQCKIMRNNGVNCILMLTKYNWREKENLPFVKSWNDLYNKICQLNKQLNNCG